MTRIEYDLYGVPIVVYPEYTHYTLDDFKTISENMGKPIIGGLYKKPFISVVMVDGDNLIGERLKRHTTSKERESGFIDSEEYVKCFKYKCWNILPIICKEILYPEDYYWMNQIRDRKKQVNLITHHVGYPMYDKVQKDSWVALQKAMVEHFNCPLVCACGGEYDGGINITGVIDVR